MEYQGLHLVHVFFALVLTGYTFYAFARPDPSTRKKVMTLTGIASLLMLLTGIRMWQTIYQFAVLPWIIVKIFCWLGVSAFAGMAYRRREKVGLFASLSLLLLFVAVSMVYFQPGK